MSKLQRILGIVAALAALAALPALGCDLVKGAKSAGASTAKRGTLITKIATRQYMISVYSGGPEMRYDVAKLSGELVAENVSLAQLQQQSPDVYQFVKSAVAIDASNRRGPASAPGGQPVFPILDSGVEQ